MTETPEGLKADRDELARAIVAAFGFANCKEAHRLSYEEGEGPTNIALKLGMVDNRGPARADLMISGYHFYKDI